LINNGWPGEAPPTPPPPPAPPPSSSDWIYDGVSIETSFLLEEYCKGLFLEARREEGRKGIGPAAALDGVGVGGR